MPTLSFRGGEGRASIIGSNPIRWKMLIISLLIIIIVTALPLFFNILPENCYNRITTLILLYCAILTFNSLSLETLNSGIGIYGGLFHITVITQFMDIILFTIASLILISWPLIKKNNFAASAETVLNAPSLRTDALPGTGGETAFGAPHGKAENLNKKIKSTSKFQGGSLDLYSSIHNKLKGIKNDAASTAFRNKENKISGYTTNYSLIILFSLLGSSLLISSYDLISMYLSIELQSFGVYVLATLYKNSEESTKAGLKYFLLGA